MIARNIYKLAAVLMALVTVFTVRAEQCLMK